ncbi:hypothetical protein J7E79_13820 [Bacillus sp. ISL-40]|uniref:hypothetical protein n=1 Tax=unclassified Bacillus (in: firmicutes) TaxID=185979 RepID=UPI001BE9B083|nr:MULTISPECIES: hypothetical protein [unclassified Bacillus (in: firmicutes)]MBT2698487.1 hypothetical protein [Bacillus sp. ISL-40]MBT2720120.1 hypothetical protein [Bacillus sp. ISL-46]MBT2739287.1 hypothetical protein [Bacillus sp. ISL-77]
MSMAEKAFLGSLMKAEYLLTDTVIQPEQLESTWHKELMRKLVFASTAYLQFKIILSIGANGLK